MSIETSYPLVPGSGLDALMQDCLQACLVTQIQVALNERVRGEVEVAQFFEPFLNMPVFDSKLCSNNPVFLVQPHFGEKQGRETVWC